MTFYPTLSQLANLLAATRVVTDEAAGGYVTGQQLLDFIDANGGGSGGKTRPVIRAAGSLYPPMGGVNAGTSSSAATADAPDQIYAYLCPLALVIDAVATHINTAMSGLAKFAIYEADVEYAPGKGGLLPGVKIWGDDVGVSVNATGVVAQSLGSPIDLGAYANPVWLMYKANVASVRRAGVASSVTSPFSTGTSTLSFNNAATGLMSAPHAFATSWPASLAGTSWAPVFSGSPPIIGVRAA
jgi:hypothetical protein